MATVFSELSMDENQAQQLVQQYISAFPDDKSYIEEVIQQDGLVSTGRALSRLGSPDLVRQSNTRFNTGLSDPQQVLKDLAQGWRLENAMSKRGSAKRWRGDLEAVARGWHSMPEQAARFGREFKEKPFRTTGRLLWSQIQSIPMMASSGAKTLAGQEGGLYPISGAGEPGEGMGLAGIFQAGAMAAGAGALAKGVKAGALAKPPTSAMGQIAAGAATPVAATLGRIPVKPMAVLGEVGDVLEAEFEELVGGTVSNIALGSMNWIGQKAWNSFFGREDTESGSGLDEDFQPREDANLPVVPRRRFRPEEPIVTPYQQPLLAERAEGDTVEAEAEVGGYYLGRRQGPSNVGSDGVIYQQPQPEADLERPALPVGRAAESEVIYQPSRGDLFQGAVSVDPIVAAMNTLASEVANSAYPNSEQLETEVRSISDRFGQMADPSAAEINVAVEVFRRLDEVHRRAELDNRSPYELIDEFEKQVYDTAYGQAAEQGRQQQLQDWTQAQQQQGVQQTLPLSGMSTPLATPGQQTQMTALQQIRQGATPTPPAPETPTAESIPLETVPSEAQPSPSDVPIQSQRPTEETETQPEQPKTFTRELAEIQTYEDWKRLYERAFAESMNYPPDQAGSRVFSDQMADLADAHPAFLERFEAEAEQEAGIPPEQVETPTETEVQPEEVQAEDSLDSVRIKGVAALVEVLRQGGQAANLQTKKGGQTQLTRILNSVYGPNRSVGSTDRASLKNDFDLQEAAIAQLVATLRTPLLSRAVTEGNPDKFKEILDQAKDLKSKMATITKVSGDAKRLQQYSTPIDYALLAAWALNLQPNNSVLEPSAGTGLLASWVIGSEANPQVVLNELDSGRHSLLQDLQQKSPDRIIKLLQEDARFIGGNQQLGDEMFDRIIMNPPFSASQQKKGKKQVKVGPEHILSAFQRLKVGGRLVAIIGAGTQKSEGFHSGVEANSPYKKTWNQLLSAGAVLKAEIEVAGGVYHKMGTRYKTRLLVIDKVDVTQENVDGELIRLHGGLTAKVENLEEAVDVLAEGGIRSEQPEVQPGVQTAQRTEQAPVEPSGSGTTGQTDPKLSVENPDRGSDRLSDSNRVAQRGASGTYSRPSDQSEIQQREATDSRGVSDPRRDPTSPDSRRSSVDDRRLSTTLPAGEVSQADQQKQARRERLQARRANRSQKIKDLGQRAKEWAESDTEQMAAGLFTVEQQRLVNDLAFGFFEAEIYDFEDYAIDLLQTAGTSPKIQELIHTSYNALYGMVDAVADRDSKFAEILGQMADREQRKAFDLQALADEVDEMMAEEVGIQEADTTPTETTPLQTTSVVTEDPQIDTTPIEEPSSVVDQEVTEPEDTKVFSRFVAAPVSGYDNAADHQTLTGAIMDESVMMASTPAPELTYSPVGLEENVGPGIKVSDDLSIRMSSLQLETVARAGQSHQILRRPNENYDEYVDSAGSTRVNQAGETVGYRQGFMFGHGTGSGKGLILAGIIKDNWNQGRKKSIWISKGSKLFHDAKRDMADIGLGEDKVFMVNDWNYNQSIDKTEGTLYVSYESIIQSAKRGQETKFSNRLEQILDWLGDDFDGPILFDEAHKMGNAIEERSGARGTKKASKAATYSLNLQRQAPMARVVYSTATAATELKNYMYAERLGIWGDDGYFNDSREFRTDLERQGLAGLEVFCKDLKATGRYMAAQLSYDGVEFDESIHNLTPEQTELYNTLVSGLSQVYASMRESSDNTNSPWGQVKGQFWGWHQRLIRQVLMSFQVPTIIAQAEQALAEGKSVVMQLVNTDDAANQRAYNKGLADGVPLDEIDFSTKATVIDFIENQFPVQRYEEYEDDQGRTQTRAMVDSQGNDILDPTAVAKRDELIQEINDRWQMPEMPLDQIITHFGVDNVSEMTGRMMRFPFREETVDGEVVYRRVAEKGPGKYSDKNFEAEADLFNNGHKKSNYTYLGQQSKHRRILIFSDAGGTGKSYHAGSRFNNQQQRFHMVLQPGWIASSAMQALGRSHRSGQSSTPQYDLMATNVPSQKRFLGAIAHRLSSLGGASRGQRETTSGLFGEEYDIFVPEATPAIVNTFEKIEGGRGVSLLSGNYSDLLDYMGLEMKVPDQSRPNERVMELYDTTDPEKQRKTFFNRLMNVPIELQHEVFEMFMSELAEIKQQTRQEGTADEGVSSIDGANPRIDYETEIGTNLPNVRTSYAAIKTDVPLTRTSLTAVLGRENDLRFVPAHEGISGGARIRGAVGVFRDSDGKLQLVEVTRADAEGVALKITRPVQNRAEYKKMKSADFFSRYAADSRQGPDAYKAVYRFIQDREAANNDELQNQVRTGWLEEQQQSPETAEITTHMIMGAFLPIWQSVKAYMSRPDIRRVDLEDGSRLLGVQLPLSQFRAILERLNIASQGEADAARVYNQIMEQNVKYLLANGSGLRRSKVDGVDRVELTFGADSKPTYGQDQTHKRNGLLIESKNSKKRYFVPTDRGPEVLGNLLARRDFGLVGDPIVPGSEQQGLVEEVAVTNPLTEADVPRVPDNLPPEVEALANANGRAIEHYEEDAGIGLVRALATRGGKILYLPFKERTIFAEMYNVDVNDFDNSKAQLFTSEELQRLKNIGTALKEAEDRRQQEMPDGPFTDNLDTTSPVNKWDGGQVVGVGPQISKELVDFTAEMMQMFGLKKRVLLGDFQGLAEERSTEENRAKYRLYGEYARSTEFIGTPSSGDAKGSKASFGVNGEDYVIHLSQETLGQKSVVEVLAHEIGHILHDQKLDSAGPAVKAEIRNAYRAWRAKVVPQMKDKKIGDAARQVYPAATIEDIITSGTGLGEQADQYTEAPVEEAWQNQLSYREFVANQFARWTTTSSRPRNVVEKFFNNLFKELKRLYIRVGQILGTPANQVEPRMSELFESWMEGIDATPPPSGTRYINRWQQRTETLYSLMQDAKDFFVTSVSLVRGTTANFSTANAGVSVYSLTDQGLKGVDPSERTSKYGDILQQTLLSGKRLEARDIGASNRPDHASKPFNISSDILTYKLDGFIAEGNNTVKYAVLTNPDLGTKYFDGLLIQMTEEMLPDAELVYKFTSNGRVLHAYDMATPDPYKPDTRPPQGDYRAVFGFSLDTDYWRELQQAEESLDLNQLQADAEGKDVVENMLGRINGNTTNPKTPWHQQMRQKWDDMWMNPIAVENFKSIATHLRDLGFGRVVDAYNKIRDEGDRTAYNYITDGRNIEHESLVKPQRILGRLWSPINWIKNEDFSARVKQMAQEKGITPKQAHDLLSENMVDVAEGKADAIDPIVLTAVNWWKEARASVENKVADINRRNKQYGLIGPPITATGRVEEFKAALRSGGQKVIDLMREENIDLSEEAGTSSINKQNLKFRGAKIRVIDGQKRLILAIEDDTIRFYDEKLMRDPIWIYKQSGQNKDIKSEWMPEIDAYFPHMVDWNEHGSPNAVSGQKRAKWANYLAAFAEANGLHIDQAERILTQMRDDMASKTYGNLEIERKYNQPFYSKDFFAVASSFLASAHRRLAEIEYFGQNNEQLREMMYQQLKPEDMTFNVTGVKDELRLRRAIYKLRQAFGFNDDLPDISLFASQDGQSNPFFEVEGEGENRRVKPVLFDPEAVEYSDLNKADWQILRQAKILNKQGQDKGKLYYLNVSKEGEENILPFGLNQKKLKAYEDAKRMIFMQLGHNPATLYEKELNDSYRTLRNLSVWSRMGYSWAANLGQSYNTVRWVGLKNFASAVASNYKKMDEDWAKATGGVVDDMSAWYSGGGYRADALLGRITPFQAIENFNRTIATLAGRHHLVWALKKLIQDIDNKTAMARFTELGFKPKEVLEILAQKYTEADVDQVASTFHKNQSARLKPLGALLSNGAKRTADKTQHKVDPIDLPPLFYRTPLGRLITQFLTFNQKQSQFVWDSLKRDRARIERGEYGRVGGSLIESLVAAFGFGYASVLMGSFARGKKDDEDLELSMRSAVNSINQVAALGVLSNIMETRKIPGAISSMFAPRIVGIAGQVVQSPKQALKAVPYGQTVVRGYERAMEAMEAEEGTALEQIRRRSRPPRAQSPQPPRPPSY